MKTISGMSAGTLARLQERVKIAIRRSSYRWRCDREDCDGLPHEGWAHNHARGKQHPPKGRWLIWLILAGRGSGKTRTGARHRASTSG
jgi:hypothetical protein